MRPSSKNYSSDTPSSKSPSEASTYGSNRSDKNGNYRLGRDAVELQLIGDSCTVDSQHTVLSAQLEKIGGMFNTRLSLAFSRIKESIAIGRTEKHYLRPILQLQCEASSSSLRERSRSIVTRHHRAQELLESIPLKYKKKMRQMIEDYESERIDLMKQLKNRAADAESIMGNDLEREQLLGRISQLESDNEELRIGYQEILKVLRPKILKFETVVKEQLQCIMEEIAELQRKIKQQGAAYSQSTHREVPKTTNNTKPLQMKALGSRPSLSPRKKKSQDVQPSTMTSRGKLTNSTQYTTPRRIVDNNSEDEEFGKEKVIEKKAIRRLLRNLQEAMSNDDTRRECLEELGRAVGLDMQIPPTAV